jgi:hypothetical protein
MAQDVSPLRPRQRPQHPRSEDGELHDRCVPQCAPADEPARQRYESGLEPVGIRACFGGRFVEAPFRDQRIHDLVLGEPDGEPCGWIFEVQGVCASWLAKYAMVLA